MVKEKAIKTINRTKYKPIKQFVDITIRATELKFKLYLRLIASGWINGCTSPHWLILNSDRYIVPYMIVICAVQASFCQPLSMVNITPPSPPCHVAMLQLPPPQNATYIVPPAVYSINTVVAFYQSVSRRNHNAFADDTITIGNDYGNISMVNCCPITGYIYDDNGNRISWLLWKLFEPILHAVGPFLFTIFKCIESSTTMRVGAVSSTIVLSIVQSHFYPNVLFNPILSKADYLNVLRLGIETWANTACVGKHAFLE